MKVRARRVEAPITDHLREFALGLEKYKAVQHLSCGKIEIKRTTIFFNIFLS